MFWKITGILFLLMGGALVSPVIMAPVATGPLMALAIVGGVFALGGVNFIAD